MKYSKSVADTKARYARSLAYRKITVQKCEICGSDQNVERHHWNYDYPLDVNQWCQTCHAQKHAELRRIQRLVKRAMQKKGLA
jgi:hypothetical protein